MNLKRILALIVLAAVLTMPSASAASTAIGVWEGLGPEGGRVESLIFSPDYAHDGNMFAKTTGAVFRSVDAGLNWTKMTIGADAQNIQKVALSPRYGIDRTIFALTAKGVYRSSNGGADWRFIKRIKHSAGNEMIVISPNYAADKTVFVGHGQGARFKIFKSVDQGLNWTPRKIGRLSWAPPVSFLFSPNYAKDKTILAGIGEDGVYRSTDRGQTWRRIAPDTVFADIIVLEFSPNYAKDKTILFGMGGGGDDSLLASQDGGRSWQKGISGNARSLVFSPDYRRDKTVFAAGNDGLHKSTDSGKTWNMIKPSPGSTYIIAMAVSPDYRRDKTIYMVRHTEFKPGQNLFRSTDGGRTWRKIGRTLRAGASINALTPSPAYRSDKGLFAATDGGVFASTDKGKTWARRNSGLRAGSVGPVVPSPNFAVDKTIFAVGDTGIYGTVDGGRNWKRIRGSVDDYPAAMVVSPDYAADRTIFVSDYKGVHKSTDGGSTWVRLKTVSDSPGGRFAATPLAVSPDFGADRTLFAVASGPDRLLKSTNGGATWREIRITFRGYTIIPEAIVFSPSFATDRTVFAADSMRLFKSTDGGRHWRRIRKIKIPRNSGFSWNPTDMITGIIVSPDFAHDRTLILAAGARTARSGDGGATWAAVRTAGDIWAFSPNFGADNTIFKASGFPDGTAAVSRSIDNGANWTPVANGLSEYWVQAIAVSPNYADDKTIFAGTRGGGVMSYTFAD